MYWRCHSMLNWHEKNAKFWNYGALPTPQGHFKCQFHLIVASNNKTEQKIHLGILFEYDAPNH